MKRGIQLSDRVWSRGSWDHWASLFCFSWPYHPGFSFRLIPRGIRMIATIPSTSFPIDIQIGGKNFSSPHEKTKALSFLWLNQWKAGAIPKPIMSTEETGMWYLAETPGLESSCPCGKGEGMKDTVEATDNIHSTFQLDQAPTGHAPLTIFIFGFPACSTGLDTCRTDDEYTLA